MMRTISALVVFAAVSATSGYDSDFFTVSGGYLEASGGANGNLKCGNWPSLGAARTECRSNQDCDGLSWGPWGGGLGGCLKKNRNAGYKTSTVYTGHHKSAYTAPGGRLYSPTEQLLSFQKPAKQASTAYGADASRAVDGDANTEFSGKSCTHTKRCKGPWWAVDLGKSCLVTKVVITNRSDCCWQRLSDFSIKVGNGRTYLWNPACVTGGEQGRGETKSWPCNLEGRIVAIQLKGVGFLSLCEVEVWGFPPVAESKPPGRFSGERVVDRISMQVSPQTWTQNTIYRR